MPVRTSTTRRKFIAASAAAGALAALPAPFVRAQSRMKLRIGIVPLISSGPIFLAEARKYFDKVGLDVEI
ncbi:MAG: twin-arginine translocation signal domain-containing protein [Burkholderiales bacterium]|nr:twin-arginine translocation signal domain-containing protein [Burkholderiales bacterium]